MRPSSRRKIYEAAIRLFAERGTADINISELADLAGVARGTIYNNIASAEKLFEKVATELAQEMIRRVMASSAGNDDPVTRLSNGIRCYVRRAYEEPDWARFVSRFAITSEGLRLLWLEGPAEDIRGGVALGKFKLRDDQMDSVLALIGSSVIGAMYLVLEGVLPWQEAGSNASEFVLRALGVPVAQVRKIAAGELPLLPV